MISNDDILGALFIYISENVDNNFIDVKFDDSKQIEYLHLKDSICSVDFTPDIEFQKLYIYNASVAYSIAELYYRINSVNLYDTDCFENALKIALSFLAYEADKRLKAYE